MSIIYIDRQTGQAHQEKIYKEPALRFLYDNAWLPHFIQRWMLAVVKGSFFSIFYGYLQKRPASAKKIVPFIKEFGVDEKEFLEPVSSFRSFNDFFIRRLKSDVRPLPNDQELAVIPADGRYYFYENIAACEGFIIKGQKFD